MKKKAQQELRLVVVFIKTSSIYWHSESGRRLSPQGVATVESKIAAAKSMVLRELAESLEKLEHLSDVWKEDRE